MFRIARWAAVVVGVLLLPVGYIVAYEALSVVLPPVIYTLGGVAIALLILGGIGGAIVGVAIVRTRLAQLAGQRVEFDAVGQMALTKAQQAKIMVITAKKDEQLVIRDDNIESYYRQLHRFAGTHMNGRPVEPTAAELQMYRDYHGAPGRSSSNEALMIEAPQEDTLPLLPALDHADNILIVGGKGSGKTTLLQWIEASRIKHQEIVVMDSHAEPAQWQGRMVGFGRDYEMILAEMKLSLRELDRRYKRRTKGDKSYHVTTSIIDEFTLLPDTLKEHFAFEVKTYSRPLLTEGRKVKMNCIWGIHSDRVEALGMKGAGDLKECFDVVVHLKNVKGNRYAICDFGEGKEDTKYIHPGPFNAPARSQTTQRENKPPKPTPAERKILVAWWNMRHDPDFSGSKLYREVTGSDSRPNSKQLEKYRNLLRKFGQNPNF